MASGMLAARTRRGRVLATSWRGWRSRSRSRRTQARAAPRGAGGAGVAAEGAPDLARLAHHAQAAGDAEAVLIRAARPREARASAPTARRRSTTAGAALRASSAASSAGGASSARAMELFLTVEFEEAVEAQEQAVALRSWATATTHRGAELPGAVALERRDAAEALATGQRAPEPVEARRAPPVVAASADDDRPAAGGRGPGGGARMGRRVTELAEHLDEPRGRVTPCRWRLGRVLQGNARGGTSSRDARAGAGAGLEDIVAATYVILVRTAGRLRD